MKPKLTQTSRIGPLREVCSILGLEMIIFRLLGPRVKIFHQDLKTRPDDFLDHMFPQYLLTQNLILIDRSTRFQRIVRPPTTS